MATEKNDHNVFWDAISRSLVDGGSVSDALSAANRAMARRIREKHLGPAKTRPVKETFRPDSITMGRA